MANFKKVIDTGDATAFKFEKPGQVLEGYYRGTGIIQIDGQDVAKHLFENDKGLWSVLGQYKLTELLRSVKPGTMVRATYTHSQKAKKGNMKVYDLEQDETNTDFGGNTAASYDDDAGVNDEFDAPPPAPTVSSANRAKELLAKAKHNRA